MSEPPGVETPGKTSVPPSHPSSQRHTVLSLHFPEQAGHCSGSTQSLRNVQLSFTGSAGLACQQRILSTSWRWTVLPGQRIEIES